MGKYTLSWMKYQTLSTNHDFLGFFHGKAFGNFIFLNILGYTLFKDSIQLIADVCQTIIVFATLLASDVDRAFFTTNRAVQLLRRPWWCRATQTLSTALSGRGGAVPELGVIPILCP